MTKAAPTLEGKLVQLNMREASRDHLLKDGMRVLDAAEVAYLLGFANYRNAYREPIARSRRGWLAKDVKRHLEAGRVAPTTARQSQPRANPRPSQSQPWFGPGAA